MSYTSQEERDMQIRPLLEHVKCKNWLHFSKPGKVLPVNKRCQLSTDLSKNLNDIGIH